MATLIAKIETQGQLSGDFRLKDVNGSQVDSEDNVLFFSSELIDGEKFKLYVTVTGHGSIKYKLNISGVSEHNHDNDSEITLSDGRDRFRINITA